MPVQFGSPRELKCFSRNRIGHQQHASENTQQDSANPASLHQLHSQLPNGPQGWALEAQDEGRLAKGVLGLDAERSREKGGSFRRTLFLSGRKWEGEVVERWREKGRLVEPGGSGVHVLGE